MDVDHSKTDSDKPNADAEALEHLRIAEEDLEKARAEEGQAETEIKQALEELERARHRKDSWIVVNGRRKEVDKERITFEEVVLLAFPVRPPGQDVQFTVQYTRGPESKPYGTLVDGQSVKVKDGMEFDVTATNRS